MRSSFFFRPGVNWSVIVLGVSGVVMARSVMRSAALLTSVRLAGVRSAILFIERRRGEMIVVLSAMVVVIDGGVRPVLRPLTVAGRRRVIRSHRSAPCYHGRDHCGDEQLDKQTPRHGNSRDISRWSRTQWLVSVTNGFAIVGSSGELIWRVKPSETIAF